MDALIFVDTNILLDFYRVRSGGGGLELLDLIEKHKDVIITGSQVEMEYKKNRQRVILESLNAQKTPDWSGITPPAFLTTSKVVRGISESKKRLTTQHKKLKDKIAKILDNPSTNDPVFKALAKLFSNKNSLNLDRDKKIKFAIRNLARKRFCLGYPPRKKEDNSIGDAVNWEWVIYCAQQTTKDIIIVTRDSDYGVSYDNKLYLNDWLRKEFKERVSRKRKIILLDKLAQAFKLVSIPVSQRAIQDEENIIQEKAESPIVDAQNA